MGLRYIPQWSLICWSSVWTAGQYSWLLKSNVDPISIELLGTPVDSLSSKIWTCGRKPTMDLRPLTYALCPESSASGLCSFDVKYPDESQPLRAKTERRNR